MDACELHVQAYTNRSSLKESNQIADSNRSQRQCDPPTADIFQLWFPNKVQYTLREERQAYKGKPDAATRNYLQTVKIMHQSELFDRCWLIVSKVQMRS